MILSNFLQTDIILANFLITFILLLNDRRSPLYGCLKSLTLILDLLEALGELLG